MTSRQEFELKDKRKAAKLGVNAPQIISVPVEIIAPIESVEKKTPKKIKEVVKKITSKKKVK